MIDFFRAGGFSMWIVLALGAATLGAALALLRDPDVARLGRVRALTWAAALAVAAGVASNVMAVLYHVAHREEWAREPLVPLLQGFAEALSPAVLGFTMLSVAWLVVAVAVRRIPSDR